MSAGPWAAVLGNLFWNKTKEKPLPKEKLVHWTSFESLDRKYRVDFSESDKDFVEGITLPNGNITHHGIEFRLSKKYSRDSRGNYLDL
jgi:hypothetical protein